MYGFISHIMNFCNPPSLIRRGEERRGEERRGEERRGGKKDYTSAHTSANAQHNAYTNSHENKSCYKPKTS